MRRRRRWLNIVAVLSLLLCIAIVPVWAIGYRKEPGIRGVYWARPSFYAQVMTHKHILTFNLAVGDAWPQLQAMFFPAVQNGVHLLHRGDYGARLDGHVSVPTNMAYSGVSFSGASGTRLANGTQLRARIITIAIDHWLLLIVFGAIGFTARRLALRPARKGVCANCGYDLRATPDCCPECGTPAALRVSS